MSDKLLTIQEVSEAIRIPVGTLRQMRRKGTGPKAARLGRRLFWRESDVTSWIEEQFATASSQ